jgi:hypothetical protein
LNSNDKLARLAGLLYLILLPTTGPAFFSGLQLLGKGDAGTILAYVVANRDGFEFMILLGAIGFVDYLALAVVFYRLFSPVSKDVARLMVTFMVASVPLSLAALARRMDVLSVLDGARNSPGLGVDQMQAQVMSALQGANNLMLVAAIFWGLWLFPLGWLVFRSGFVPRVLGVLLMLGGFWYALIFVGTVLNPGYQETLMARAISFISGVPSVIGEMGTALWLLFVGMRARPAK